MSILIIILKAGPAIGATYWLGVLHKHVARLRNLPPQTPALQVVYEALRAAGWAIGLIILQLGLIMWMS